MEPHREYEGRNVKKAVQAASRDLDIDPNDLQYDVISYGSSGIFGLVGTKKARIRVSMPTKRQPNNQSQLAKNQSDELPLEIVKRDEDSNDDEEPAIEMDSPSEVETDSDPEHPLGDGNEQNPKQPEDNQTISLDEAETIGREALERIVNAITQDAEIVSKQNRGQIDYDVKGGNTAIIIGKRGQTLEATQYLVEKIVNKNKGHRIRVNIDAGNYMLKRRENLEQIASRVANKARKTRRPASLGQLNPHDRRIVHMALRSDEGVWTKSLGDGHLRKLVIYPKRRPNEEHRRESR